MYMQFPGVIAKKIHVRNYIFPWMKLMLQILSICPMEDQGLCRRTLNGVSCINIRM